MSEENRQYIDYVNDILDAMVKAENFVAGMTYEEFIKDDKTQFAVIRALEVAGEATKHIPEDVRSKFSWIPWQSIAGMRDVLIHDYFNVDTETLWVTVTRDVPEAKSKLIEMINKLKPN